MGKCVREDCRIKERLSTADQEETRVKRSAETETENRESSECRKERQLRARDGEGCISNVD